MKGTAAAMKPIRLSSLALLSILAFSCSAARGNYLKLDPTPPLSGGPGWAVVMDAYARLKDSPSPVAKDLSHLRRGELLEVLGRDLGPEAAPGQRGVWYKLKVDNVEGWVQAESLDVFPTKDQATLTAAKYL
jgi:hypothetical protein